MPTGSASTKPQGATEAQALAVIRRVMADQGMTQATLAAASGMSPSQLTNVFKGLKTARFSEVAAMCDALGLRLSDVLAEVERER